MQAAGPAVRHRRGLDEHGARLAGRPRARAPATCAARSRSSRGLARAGAAPGRRRRRRRSTGRRLDGDYRPHPRPHRRTWSRASSDFEAQVGEPGGFVLPQRPARRARASPPRPARRSFTVNPLEYPRVPRGAAAAADAALARPVQHHDLRPGRPVPRHPAAAGGWCSCNADDLADARPRRRRHRRPRVASGGRRRRARAPRRSASSPTDTPRGCAAAYFPETNVLVPLDSVADDEQHPDLEGGRRSASSASRIPVSA